MSPFVWKNLGHEYSVDDERCILPEVFGKRLPEVANLPPTILSFTDPFVQLQHISVSKGLSVTIRLADCQALAKAFQAAIRPIRQDGPSHCFPSHFQSLEDEDYGQP